MKPQISIATSFGLLNELSDRLRAVHLSDRSAPHVDHMIPGEGFIDWDMMCTRLRAADYDRPILMEVMMQHSRFQSPVVFLREAYQSGCRTWDLIHESE